MIVGKKQDVAWVMQIAEMSDHFGVSFRFELLSLPDLEAKYRPVACCLTGAHERVIITVLLEPFVEYFRDRKRVVVKYRAQYLHICTG